MSNECDLNPEMAVEFNADDIPAGTSFERTIVVHSKNQIYNNKAFRIRSLSGAEFRQITAKIKLMKGDVASNFLACQEACRIAVLTPGVAEKVPKIPHDVILQIGGEILDVSDGNEEAVEDFTEADKAD